MLRLPSSIRDTAQFREGKLLSFVSVLIFLSTAFMGRVTAGSMRLDFIDSGCIDYLGGHHLLIRTTFASSGAIWGPVACSMTLQHDNHKVLDQTMEPLIIG